MRVQAYFAFVVALFLSPALFGQLVSVSGLPTGCVAKTTKIRIISASVTSGNVVKVRVEKVSDWCSSTTFMSGGRLELREGSATGPTVATASYGPNATPVELSFTQPLYGNRTLYAVVASDWNLYRSATPITVSGKFKLLDQAPGIRLYSYTCSGCSTDYVLEVDLTIARIRSLLGDVTGTATASTTDQYARSKVSTFRTPLEHYGRAVNREPNVFATLNFGFFDLDRKKIAFPLKIGNGQGGDTISYGYGLYPTTGGEFANQYRYLRFDNEANTSSVGSLNYPTSQTLASTDTWLKNQMLLSGAEIACGLTPSAPKNATSNIPRVFAGVVDRTKDNRPEILFYASKIATQAYATQILRGFGVPDSSILMADGGSSAQFVVRTAGNPAQGQVLVGTSARSVPHIFAIYSGW